MSKKGREFMSIEFGMPTLIELTDLEENAKLCNNLGLKFIELNMNLPQYQIESMKKTKMFQDISKEYGVYYTIHLDENLNISDFNQAVTKAYLDTVIQALMIAKELEIPLLNMHMNRGVYFTLPEQKIFLFEKFRDSYLRSIQYFKTICENLIGGDNLIITIENTEGYPAHQREAIDILLESPVFALTWDIGHSHSADDIDEKYIMQNECKLKHFHIHDANGKKNHLTLGEGNINLLEKLNIANQNHCRCVIETKTVASLHKSLNWLNTHWEQ
ncbi:TIM barrel protein [Lacrimispora celerecrescens]|uniref:Sugar phosphate isomerase/epimerase n=1 Tax=[Clostridium] celerecrescens 18A TaxID=1286362 RepID=A0A2M8Z186_9FIRM|nr:TIM barrel protein [Lacrimispora celerecrescens]PJJ27195.1 sugar phosphate isomerase/epimerase [[Clostridium] celerecrescens 18A]